MRTQGTHICQRAAIARSSDGGTKGPAEGRGAQGSIMSRTLSLCRIIASYVPHRYAVAMAHSCVDAVRAFRRYRRKLAELLPGLAGVGKLFQAANQIQFGKRALVGICEAFFVA
jgi:hypothetical protein